MLPFKKIMAPVDFSRASLQALEQAKELARHFQSGLLVVNVVPPIPALPPDPNFVFEVSTYEQALQSNAEERLQEVVQNHLPPELQARAMIGFGDPAHEIVRIAQEEAVDLIVIATHGLSGWKHLVFGSVAEKVVRFAPCPVLSIRIPDETS